MAASFPFVVFCVVCGEPAATLVGTDGKPKTPTFTYECRRGCGAIFALKPSDIHVQPTHPEPTTTLIPTGGDL